MERTRIFRRPIFWIFVVIAGAILVSQMFTSGPSYQDVDTSFALQQLDNGGVNKALILDKEQTLQLDFKEKIKLPNGDETTRIKAQYPSGADTDIYNKVIAAKSSGKILDVWSTEVTKESVLLSLLVNLLPIAI